MGRTGTSPVFSASSIISVHSIMITFYSFLENYMREPREELAHQAIYGFVFQDYLFRIKFKFTVKE
jgi:hypothetical protein